MATLEQIGQALTVLKAQGKLNTPEAQTLAQAYRQMQGGAPPLAPGPRAGTSPPMPPLSPSALAYQQGQATRPQTPAPTPQQQVDAGLEAYRVANYPNLTVSQFQKQAGKAGAPLDLQQIAQNDQLFGFGDELNGLASGTAAMLAGKDFGKNYDAGQRLQEARRNLGLQQGGLPAQIASVVGNLTSLGSAPSMAVGAAGKAPGIAKTMLTGGATGAGLGAAQGYGSTDGDVTDRLAGAGAGAGAGAIVGAASPLIFNAAGQFINRAVKNQAVNAAIKAAPDATALRSQAGAMFDSATGAEAPAISAPAYNRLMQDTQFALTKFRPNAANDPQAVGLLSHMAELDKAANTPGVVVDLKDLHLTRQLAQKVAQSPSGRDSAIGSIVVKQIDKFVNSLQAGDILGGADPKAAVSALTNGISTWSRALKVGAIEDAVKAAETYKSGVANGLKLSFLKLMKSPDWSRFSQIEQDAIRKVAVGSPVQNIAELFGKMGFSFSGSAAHNIIGGGLGTGALGAALTPVLGPLAYPAALAGTTLTGIAGRAASEAMGQKAAARAAQIAATPGIPSIPNFKNIPSTLLPLVWGQGTQ